MIFWVRLQRLALLLLAVGLAVLAGLLFTPRINRLNKLQESRAEMEEECKATENLIEAITAKQKRFASEPAFVEYTARRQGLIKPDEVVFKITGSSTGGTHEAGQ